MAERPFQVGDRVRLRGSDPEQYGWVRQVSWSTKDPMIGVRWDPYVTLGFRNRAVPPDHLELVDEPPIDRGPAALVEWLDA